MKLDTGKDSLFALIRGADCRAPYRLMFGGRIVNQHDIEGSVDFVPDDPAMPGMGGLPLKLGLPGTKVKLRFVGSEIRAAVGFENADPARPFALLVAAEQAAVERVTL